MAKNRVAALAVALIALSAQTAGAQWQACGSGPDAGVCLAIMCKPDGALGFYGTGIDTTGLVDVIVSLASGDYSLSPMQGFAVDPYPIGFFTAFPQKVVEGLKTDRMAAIGFAGHRVEISLDGSFAAISSLQQSCVAPARPGLFGPDRLRREPGLWHFDKIAVFCCPQASAF